MFKVIRKGTLALAVAAVVLLALGVGLGPVFPSHVGTLRLLPGAAAQTAAPASGYSDKLQVFAQVIDLIQQNYVEPKGSKEIIYGAIRGALSTLDPHSSFLTPEDFRELQIETKGRFSGIGIEITLRNRILTVVSPIEGTPAFRAGLQAGDQIIKINGKPTRHISLTEAVRLIRGPKGTKVTLTINREGFVKPRDFTIVRDIIPIRSVKARIIPGGIGYIRVASFQDQTDRDLRNYLHKMRLTLKPFRGLILDLRNDPGGLLEQAVQVADEFLSHGLIVYTRGRSPREQSMNFYARPGQEGEIRNFPLVVLINEGSASASEIVAGALKDRKRALVVGTKSFGKGSVQTIIPLEDGSALRLTTAYYYTPSGRTIQEKGILPDIQVKEREIPPGKSLQALRDEALERHMRGEGLTDKPWNQPLTPEELKRDPVLAKAVEVIRNWPPKKLARRRPSSP
ncbi:MAG: S41 family peptidase [Deltaproteobacteria bacterium]|nr:S41 family peptidase [Deltaproteobacteria bacterium]